MRLEELQRPEQLAFAGLVRLLVRIDGEFSPGEVTALASLAKELGSGAFWTLMREAQQELGSAEDVVEVVETVTRREVQDWIYGVLLGLAAVDGIQDAESQVLDWLMHTWQLG